MHSAELIENSIGPAMRRLSEDAKNLSVYEVIQTKSYRQAVSKLFSGIATSLENMHSVAPILARYLCKICKILLTKQDTFWTEISSLLVYKVFVSTPINEVAQFTYRIIEQVWMGPLEDVQDLPWLLTEMPAWRQRLKRAFESMYSYEPRDIEQLTLPETLIISDLVYLKLKMKGFPWGKCPAPRKPNVYSVNSFTVSVQTAENGQDIATQTDDELIQQLRDELLAYNCLLYTSDAADE